MTEIHKSPHIASRNDSGKRRYGFGRDHKQAVIEKKAAAASGEATIYSLFGIFTWGVSNFADDSFVMRENNNSFLLTIDPLAVAKQGAVYNACKTANSDMLLGAKYVINTNDYFVFKTINCKATGFPGVLKDVK